MAAENYYEILGLRRGASDEDVKQAFRDLAKSLHPDRNPDDPEAERRFKLVGTAYEALKDDARRRAYDEWLAFARKHERSRLAQWGRLGALLVVLLLAPSIALYWAYMLLEGYDSPRPPRQAVAVNAQKQANPNTPVRREAESKPSTAPAPAPITRPAPIPLPETSRQAAAPQTPPARPDATAAAPDRPEPPAALAPRETPPPPASPPVRAEPPSAPPPPQAREPAAQPPADRAEAPPAPPARPEPPAAAPPRETPPPPAARAEAPPPRPAEPVTRPAPIPLPETARQPAPPPEAATAEDSLPRRENTPPRQSLRELTGADQQEDAPPPAAPERRAERTSPPPQTPATPRQSESQESAARSMARMIAEIEAGGTPINRRPGEPQRQAALPPDEPRRPTPPQELGGDDFTDCERCPVMSVVTATDFLGQGARPNARQSGGRNMAVSKSEVTVGEWIACAREGACRGLRDQESGNPRRPVVNVTREDAAEYAAWLSRKTGRSYRLMKVGGWSAGTAPQRRGAADDAQDDDACGGADWRWLDDPECARRARNRENASARQPAESGFYVTRSLGPDG